MESIKLRDKCGKSEEEFVIADFVKEGILERRKSGYKVVNIEKLREISRG